VQTVTTATKALAKVAIHRRR